jgi:ABC-type multidrug transport system ATPase subunit
VVAARDLGRTIDDRPILQQINLEITPGGFLALLGANGAGKSTLLHVLATLLPRTTGTLSLFDKPVNRNATALRRRIGMIGHQPMLYRDLTARENLIFFGAMYGVADRRQRAEALLERVGLIDRADDPIKTFSRGMVQRTSIARALMHRPQLLLADEPFAGLDVVSNDRLAGLLGELNAEGHTIVVAHHDLAQSLAVARRVVILRSGQVAMDSPVAQVSLKDVRQEVAAG